jgi:hypothetical protein
MKMRYMKILGVLIFVMAVWALPCAAQSAPGGSYQQTCRNIQAYGNHMEAECQTRDGGWRRTSLDGINQCSGEIVNDDGNLTCGRGNYGYANNGNGYGWGNGRRHRNNAGWQNGYPQGDYVQTCRNIRMNGDHMDAECQKRDGGWRNTSLDNVSQCGGIVNNNGRLQCGSGGYGFGGYNNGGYTGGYNGGYYNNGRWNGGNPPGNYVQTCRNITTNGNRLDAECQTRDGNWRRTSLNNLDRCTGDVANDNGHLVCGR